MLELASSGTVFLDEIGEMPVKLQVKLLRVIQERKMNRLGGTQSIPVDARILAATNRSLEESIKQGSFREDIPILTGHFINKLSNRIGRPIKGIDPDAPGFRIKRGTLDRIQKQAIIEALSSWEGNRTRAAEELGISRQTLLNKIKEYSLE